MIYSYNWLQSYFKTSLPRPEQLAEILTMHAFENESVEKKGDDHVLSIDVLPDRAGDCSCHLGVAKELAVLTGSKLVLPIVKVKENKEKVKSFVSVKVEDPKDCRRYTARVLTNVKVKPSPKWLQERLNACGLNSINNVVDATNFVMLEMGQPLHAFDAEKLSDGIIVRRAQKGEKIMTLSDKEYVLDENILVIADSSKILALAGIKGGRGCEITDNTKTIVLESANFNPKLISQTARKLNLRTDASVRYEHNLDPNLTEAAIDRVASLIAEMAEADIVSGKIDVYKNKVKPWNIKLDIDNVNKILGIEISKTEISAILNSLGFEVKPSGIDNLMVKVPTSRADVVTPENLIEEIGRVYGYDKIPAKMPLFSEPAKRNDDIFWQSKAKDIMVELGFVEAFNYSFIGEEEKAVYNLEAGEITNPVSSYFRYLRPTLVPQMAKLAKENSKFFKEIKAFELGKAFVGEHEIMMLSGAVTGKGFYFVKEYLNALFAKLGIEKVSYEAIGSSDIWHSKKTAEVKVHGKGIGQIGFLSSNISQVLGMEETVLFELNFDELQKYCIERKEYQQISYHPPALRDISGTVSDILKIEEIMELIKDSGGDLLRSVEVFDVYKGKGIADGKKSVSFHLTYQSEEKTLDTKTIDTLTEQLLTKLRETINWEERK